MDELIRDREAIAGLIRTSRDHWPDRQSLAYEMTFPAQEHKLHAGAAVVDPATEKGATVAALDDEADTLVVTRRKNRHDEPLPEALVPIGPLDTRAHEAALLRLATSIRDGDGRYTALRDLLDGTPARITGRPAGASIQTLDVGEQIALAKGLDMSCLVVQGPPSTGKTWLGGRMIAALIADGARVGVTAVSHKAINNVLTELEAAADERRLTYRGARRIGESADSQFRGSDRIENPADHTDCENPGLQMVAGTSWVFSREGHDQAFDYLVIDEAGQMSLADSLAVGTSARNLILLGDPQHLVAAADRVADGELVRDRLLATGRQRPGPHRPRRRGDRGGAPVPNARARRGARGVDRLRADRGLGDRVQPPVRAAGPEPARDHRRNAHRPWADADRLRRGRGLRVDGGRRGIWDRPLRTAGRVIERTLNRTIRRRRPTEGLDARLLAERDGIRDVLGEQWKVALLAASGRWIFDFAALLACLRAVGAKPNPSLVLLAYVAASLLGLIPLTPGGLGFVEAGLTGTLALAGIPSGAAVVATLAYRLVSFWLPIPAGAVAYGLFSRRYLEPAAPVVSPAGGR